MMRNNILSFLFAGVLLSLVTVTYVENKLPEEKISERIQKTSVEVSMVSNNDFVASAPQKSTNLEDAVVVNDRDSNSTVDESSAPFSVQDPFASVQALAAIMGDLDTGEIFFRKNEKQIWQIASLTKLMTAVVAKENISPNTIITITPTAVDTKGLAGGFAANEAYSVEDFIKAMIVTSSNDAAVMLAEFHGSERFIEQMNTKAEEIGMLSTHFFDSSGLSPLNQSNVGDLKKLSEYIANTHPNFFEISRQKVVSITNRNSNVSRELHNIDKFAGEVDFLGGKTGYNKIGVANFISIFSYNGRRIITVILGASDREKRFTETESLLSWLKEYRLP